jgi:hypothetical protein
MPNARQIIPFAEWLPDLRQLANPGSTVATNCIPSLTGYRPFPSLSTVSDALTNRCQGAITAQNTDATFHTYAGDDAKLYALSSDTFSDKSKVGGYSIASTDLWGFAVFNGKVIAVNIADPIQTITIAAVGLFADQATSTLTPQAKHIWVTERFPVIGHTSEGGTTYPYRVRWPNIADEADWDEDAANQSDFQDLDPNHGPVTGGQGMGRDAVVFQERGVSLMRYEGGQTIFRFDLVDKNRGAIAPRGHVAYGGQVFYLADDGFYRFTGAASEPIGREKVDAFFFDDVDLNEINRITAAISPRRSLVCWSYQSGAGGSDPDKILCYNWAIQRWSLIEQAHQLVFQDWSKGFTLEDLNTVSGGDGTLEGLPASLDSPLWAGGSQLFSSFDTTNKLAAFDGTPLGATFETAEVQHTPGQISRVQEVRPQVDGDGATVTVQVGQRDTQQSMETFGVACSPNSLGVADVDVAARYHRYRVNTTGDFKQAIGIDHDAIPWGRQ